MAWLQLQAVQVKRRIKGYHQDEEGHWVADLECGHTHHLRHIPPFFNREWVLDMEERQRRLGWTLNCADCDVEGKRER